MGKFRDLGEEETPRREELGFWPVALDADVITCQYTVPGVITGEPASLGTRSDAPRQPPSGFFHTARFAMELHGIRLEGATAAVQGFGKSRLGRSPLPGRGRRGHPSPQRPLGGAQGQRTQHTRVFASTATTPTASG